MSQSERLGDAASRGSRAVNAETQDQQRRRYDLWAAKDDQDLGEEAVYLAPMATAEIEALTRPSGPGAS